MSKFKVGDKVVRSEHSGLWKQTCRNCGVDQDITLTVSEVDSCFIRLHETQGYWVEDNFEHAQAAPDNNMVTAPKHYEFFEGVEAITIIARSMTEKQFAGYCMGNALKYRLRAGNKFNTEEDLKKADYYKELFQKHRHECIDEDI